MKELHYKTSDELFERLCLEAKKKKISRSSVINEALSEWFYPSFQADSTQPDQKNLEILAHNVTALSVQLHDFFFDFDDFCESFSGKTTPEKQPDLQIFRWETLSLLNEIQTQIAKIQSELQERN